MFLVQHGYSNTQKVMPSLTMAVPPLTEDGCFLRALKQLFTQPSVRLGQETL